MCSQAFCILQYCFQTKHHGEDLKSNRQNSPTTGTIPSITAQSVRQLETTPQAADLKASRSTKHRRCTNAMVSQISRDQTTQAFDHDHTKSDHRITEKQFWSYPRKFPLCPSGWRGCCSTRGTSNLGSWKRRHSRDCVLFRGVGCVRQHRTPCVPHRSYDCCEKKQWKQTLHMNIPWLHRT